MNNQCQYNCDHDDVPTLLNHCGYAYENHQPDKLPGQSYQNNNEYAHRSSKWPPCNYVHVIRRMLSLN
jgi:hypothetical protein